MRKCRVCLHEIEDAALICEHCGEDLIHGRRPIIVAPSIPKEPTPPSVVAATKTCPFCAELIQSAAIVCKHCGRDLIPGQLTGPSQRALIVGPPVLKVRQADWISTTAKWGVGFFFVAMLMAWCSTLVNQSASPPSRPVNAAIKPAAPTPPRSDLLALVSVTDELSSGGGYNVIQGEVENISGQSMKNVAAVANWYDKDNGFITSDTTLIEYNPILPGQRSPYKVMARHNPAMTKYSVSFKQLFGGAIATRDDRKK